MIGRIKILWNLSNGHGPRFRGKSKPKSVSHSEHGLTRCGCNLVCTRSFPVGRRSFEYGMGCSKVWHGLVAAGLSGRVVRIHHCPSHYYITTPTTHHPPRHTVHWSQAHKTSQGPPQYTVKPSERSKNMFVNKYLLNDSCFISSLECFFSGNFQHIVRSRSERLCTVSGPGSKAVYQMYTF